MGKMGKTCPSKWVSGENSLYRREDLKTGAGFTHFNHLSINETKWRGQDLPSELIEVNYYCSSSSCFNLNPHNT